MIRMEHRKERLQKKEKLRQTRILQLEEEKMVLESKVSELKELVREKDAIIKELLSRL